MGLLEQVVGGLLGGAGERGSPMQGILMNLLSGEGRGAAQARLPAQGAGGFGGGGGGLQGLVSAFEQAGLGHLVQSWVSTGPNPPVSPQQLRNVFGDEQVQAMASQSGMEEEDFLSQLSQHLPKAVDQMTPQGKLPDEGTVSV
jgi:uncharacterized protein YidB (DUF937 family)